MGQLLRLVNRMPGWMIESGCCIKVLVRDSNTTLHEPCPRPPQQSLRPEHGLPETSEAVTVCDCYRRSDSIPTAAGDLLDLDVSGWLPSLRVVDDVTHSGEARRGGVRGSPLRRVLNSGSWFQQSWALKTSLRVCRQTAARMAGSQQTDSSCGRVSAMALPLNNSLALSVLSVPSVQ